MVRRTRATSQRLLLPLALLSLTGCGPTPLILSALGINSAASGPGKSNAPPTVTLAAPLTREALAERGDADRVAVSVRLANDDGSPVQLKLEFARVGAQGAAVAGDFALATTLTGSAVGTGAASADVTLPLAAPPEGREHHIVWDAASDLAGSEARVVLRVTASDGGQSVHVDTLPFVAGNEPPEVTLGDLGPDVSGKVTVPFTLLDGAGDVADVTVELRVGDGEFRAATSASGATPEGLATLSRADGPVLHSFEWLSTDETGGVGLATVPGIQVRVVATDRFGERAEALSGPLVVRNNSQPLVLVSEPALQFDRTNEVPLRFTLIDAESHDTDVVIQWALEGESFPPLDGVREPSPGGSGLPGSAAASVFLDTDRVLAPALSDMQTPERLDLVLRDPDMRRRLHLITLASVPLDGRVGRDPTRQAVRSTVFAALGAPPRQIGRRLTFLSGANAGLVRRVAAYDPATAVATLDVPLDVPPAIGDSFILDGRRGLTQLDSSPAGVEHEVVWDALYDLGGVDSRVKLRFTPRDADPGRAFETLSFEVQNALFRKSRDLPVSGFMAVGDLSGDGLDDVAVAVFTEVTDGQLEVQVFQQTVDGQIVGPSAALGVSELAVPEIAPVGDGAGGGHALLLVTPDPSLTNVSSGTARVVFFGSTFPQVVSEHTVAREGLLVAALGDVTGDGVSDLVLATVTGTEQGTVEVATGAPGPAGDLVFGPSLSVATFTADYVFQVLVADLDDAGGQEIALLTGDPSSYFFRELREIVIVQRQPDGSFLSVATPAPADASAVFFFLPSLAAGRFGTSGPELFLNGVVGLWRSRLQPDLRLDFQPFETGFSLPSRGAILGAPEIPNGMLVADLDGDGRDDVALATVVIGGLPGGVGTQVRIFGAGSDGGAELRGTFQAPGGLAAFDLAAGDLDGDGAVDLALNQLTSIGIFSQQGRLARNRALDGAFSAATIETGDRNGDGRIDVVAVAASDVDTPLANALRLLDQSPSGALEVTANLRLNTEALVADLAGADGIPELLLGGEIILDEDLQTVAELSTATAGDPVAPNARLFSTRAPVAGDWDGDGLADLVGIAEAGVLLVRQQPGGGFEGSAREVLIAASPGGAATPRAAGPVKPGGTPGAGNLLTIALSDVDRDSRADLVVVRDDGTLELRLSEGVVGGQASSTLADTFDLTSLAGLGGALFSKAAIAFGDIDSDGRTDIVCAGLWRIPGDRRTGAPASDGARVLILTATGTRSFALHPDGPLLGPDGAESVGVAVLDATGDGRLDIALRLVVASKSMTGGQHPLPLTLFVQDEAGRIGSRLEIPVDRVGQVGTVDADLPATDLGGDGRIDLATTLAVGGLGRLIARGGDDDLLLEGKVEGAPGVGEVVVALPGPDGAKAVHRVRVRADRTFRARVPVSVLAAAVAPEPIAAPDVVDDGRDPVLVLPQAPGARRVELAVVLVGVSPAAYRGGPLPENAVALGLVLEPHQWEHRLLAGLTLSPLSTIAALGSLSPGGSAETVRDGLARAEVLVAGGAVDPGAGPLVRPGDPVAAELASDDPRLLRGLLLEALEDVAQAASTSTESVVREIAGALGTGTNPRAAELATELRALDGAGVFSAVADAIDAPIVPERPPGIRSLDPDRGPETGGTLVTIVAEGPLPEGAAVRIGHAGVVPATRVTSTTLSFTTPVFVAGPQMVTLVHGGFEGAAATFTYFTGDREAVVGAGPLRFEPPSAYIGSITGSEARFTVENPAEASGPVSILGFDFLNVGDKPSNEPPPYLVVEPATLPDTVAPGEVRTVEVRFRPQAFSVPEIVLLELQTDDPDQPRRLLRIERAQALDPFEFEPLLVGYVAVGASTTSPATVRNLADGPNDVVLQVGVEGNGPFSTTDPFALAGPELVTIPALGSAQVPIRFAPTVPGAFRSTLDASPQTGGRDGFQVTRQNLGGVGTGPRLATIPSVAAEFGPPPPIDFGMQEATGGSPPIAVRLRNDGAAAPDDPASGSLTIIAVGTTGPFQVVSAPAGAATLTAAVVPLPDLGGGMGGGGGFPKATRGGGGGPAPAPPPAVAGTLDLEVAFMPPALAADKAWQGHAGNLTISTLELATSTAVLTGSAVTGELAAGGGLGETVDYPRRDASSTLPSALRVRVHNAETGEPLAGATVLVKDPDDGSAPEKTATTAADGSAIFAAVVSAEIEVHVGAARFYRQSFLGFSAGDYAVLLFPSGGQLLSADPDVLGVAASCGDSRSLSSYLGAGLKTEQDYFSLGDVTPSLPGFARVAVSQVSRGPDGLACSVEVSGYGAWPSRSVKTPLVVRDPTLQLVGGTMSSAAGRPLDGAMLRAIATVEPPAGIDPGTGLVVGYGDVPFVNGTATTEVPWAMMAAADPLALAPAGFPGRLRVRVRATYSDTELSEVRVRLASSTAVFPEASVTPLDVALPTVASIQTPLGASLPVDVTFPDLLAMEGSPGYYRLHLGEPYGSVFWTLTLPPGAGATRTVTLSKLPGLGDNLDLSSRGSYELFLECIRLDSADRLPASGFRWHDARRRVVGRTVHGPVTLTLGGGR